MTLVGRVFSLSAEMQSVYSTALADWASDVVTKVLNCKIVVCDFELQSCYYGHFRTNTLGKYMNSLILQTMG